MARTDTTALTVAHREPSGSRGARRLRRAGNVPGVVYGGGDEPMSFSVDSRTLRLALAHAGAVMELKIDDAAAMPVVVKDLVRHPVSGETVHLDLLRVRLDQAIQATVVLELIGADDSPGAKDGGVLEQVTRELTIEALPNDIPDSLEHDVSGMEIGDTLTLESLSTPPEVTLVDDPETVIAILSAPRLQLDEEPGIEEETEVVGEGEAPAERDSSGEGDSDGDGGSDE